MGDLWVLPPMAAASGTEGLGTALVLLGLLYIVALGADYVGRKTHLPRVTLLLLAGIVAGPSILDLSPGLRETTFDIVTVIALTFVGFSLGNSFKMEWLKENGRSILLISIAVVAITAAVVYAGLWALRVEPVVAILLAGVATATAPAATRDVVLESKARGPFAQRLLAIVAIDDAWGVLLFSILLAVAAGVTGGSGIGEVLVDGAWELFGSILLGVLLGVLLAWAKDRTKSIENSLAMTLGTALLCTGLALFFDFSFLLSTMVLGAVVANLAHKSDLAFEALERVEWPILTLFFVLAGASLVLEDVLLVGVAGSAYILLRIVGRLVGGSLGAAWAGSDQHTRRWIGPALLPQAGIAIGLGFLGAQRFPEHKETLLTIVIGSTVIFEIIGPVVARMALIRSGEVAGAGPETPRTED